MTQKCVQRIFEIFALLMKLHFQVPVLSIVGEFSPILEETIALNGKLNPAASNWMKLLVIKRPAFSTEICFLVGPPVFVIGPLRDTSK